MIPVCVDGDLPEGQARRLDTVPPVAVFHGEGAYCAIDDTFTHQDTSLADGYVEDRTVECPLLRPEDR
ncbi:MAG TPA: Rieske 2Fe-2S domain-containing protein [Kineosporiaceae bacterium]